MNKALCNSCGELVTSTQQERDGRVFLIKDCPDCGTNETLISGDADRYFTKRRLDGEHDYISCGLECIECPHKNKPSFVFCDITNRCNLNCPICINNTPSMGFLFEPPIEYFDKVFRHFSQFEPPPAVQLFGGEPTVRDDMFDIISMAQSYGLPTRVVTNGVKLASEDYCRRLVETRATILIAYDGHNPETYRTLRGHPNLLRAKQKALENLHQIGGAKVALMTCVAKGFNDDELGDLLALCHERREHVRGVYFLPLAQSWDLDEFDLEPDRMTSEDIEIILDGCFPGERIEFIPAGVLGELPTLMEYLKVKRPPFMGAHPNCESMYLLVSNGTEYVPMARYLKCSVPEFVEALFGVERRLAQAVERSRKGLLGRLMGRLGLREKMLRARAVMAVARCILQNVKISHTLQGRGLGKVWHAFGVVAGMLTRRKTRILMAKHTTVHELLQLIVLPFEDDSTLETERLERCPNAFVFYDPRQDKVNSVPVCAWSRHKTKVLRQVTDYYEECGPQPVGESAEARPGA
jgi:uncharacterized radical SAM superfamily Fe-S cluster-containing enzyme